MTAGHDSVTDELRWMREVISGVREHAVAGGIDGPCPELAHISRGDFDRFCADLTRRIDRALDARQIQGERR